MSQVEADQRLLEGIRRDEPGAFDEFVRRYGDRIYGFGIRACGEPEDAKDVAQETLLQAYRALRDVKEPRALRSWLYRVVANACLMKRRKDAPATRRELSLEELMPRDRREAEVEIPDTSHLPDDEALRAEVRRSVRAAIRELAPHYRVVLLLRDVEQLTTSEAADVLELPESTVKMRLHRARLMLRRSLADAPFTQPPGGAGA